VLEKINTPGFETLSRADPTVCDHVAGLLNDGNPSPVVAEIGLGIGATTEELARILANRGELHLYDFEEKVAEIIGDLETLGYRNAVGFGNTRRHWDSYNWSLMKQVQAHDAPIYDYIYLDGAHTFLHDGLAFVLCDRLLRPGGCIDFDDYFWSIAGSKWMADTRHAFLTQEQIDAQQVKLVVDTLVRPDERYEEIVAHKVFRKRA
jgi:predicted O-methyltransferase YrrM